MRIQRRSFKPFCYFLCMVSSLLQLGHLDLRKAHATDPLAIENVQVDARALRPGEEARISFHLSQEAKVTLLIYDPDYTVVRRLMDGERRPAGVNTALWDGRDQRGVMVPDEAYLVGILAEGAKGERAIYDPTSFSGGEIFDVPVRRIEESSGQYRIHYSILYSSRISIRAGMRRGPLLKTVLDSKAVPPGDYVQTWDGMDETGRRKILRERGSLLYIRGFRLPEGTIVMEGSPGDYRSYRQNLQVSSSMKTGALSHQTVRENAMKRSEKGISPQFLVRRTLNVSPVFKVHLVDDRSTRLAQSEATEVSGQIGITVEVAPESLQAFHELRYEIVVFIDDKRFDEEEQAYSPYTYMLDTKRLTNGEHWITINLASLTDQIGSYSFNVNVRN